jgi:hypothetical protein
MESIERTSGDTSCYDSCCNGNFAHRTLLLSRHLTNREKHDACLSYSHSFAIGPDSTRFCAKCATAATDKSKFRGRDSWTAG